MAQVAQKATAVAATAGVAAKVARAEVEAHSTRYSPCMYEIGTSRPIVWCARGTSSGKVGAGRRALAMAMRVAMATVVAARAMAMVAVEEPAVATEAAAAVGIEVAPKVPTVAALAALAATGEELAESVGLQPPYCGEVAWRLRLGELRQSPRRLMAAVSSPTLLLSRPRGGALMQQR